MMTLKSPKLQFVPSSSTESQNDVVEESSGEEENGIVEERKEKGEREKNKNGKKEVKNKGKNKIEKEEEEEEKSEITALYKFPMNRVSRIIKSEDSDLRISQEAVFLINRASEKFLELFCREAYACAFMDRKKQIGYNHLSSVVSKRRRFDFLSDFVPEKVKAEDASKQMSMTEK
ncbi:nuclear factor Y [Forsythia ovata]|uniref:Nuclear factor Y n=1 Tax=Forsythia ovata TaxID=205694 RepID=A0ABD1RK73_9LAMI